MAKYVEVTTTVENAKYMEFARRVIRGAGKRMADNPDDLASLRALREEVDAAIASAVVNARSTYDLSWTEIGDRLGITRQSAHEKYRHLCKPS